MLFRNIIGQEHIKKRLIETVKNNRTGHAWLFFGPEGSGKLQLAIAVARYISCLNRGETDSCDTCSSCVKYKKFIHPDLHFSFPVNKTKNKDAVICDEFLKEWREFLTLRPYGGLAEWYESIGLDNKQGFISTEESRRITYKLSLKAYESDYKTAIFWQADRMHDQGGNRLLKLIEEPPPDTFIFLVSEKPGQILPTLRSRCMNLKIPGIEDSVMQDVLTDKHGLDKQKAAEIARIASGNYRKAIRLMQEPEEYQYFLNKFRDLMRSCYRNKIPDIIKITDELASLNRERQKTFLEYGLGLIREGLAMHYDQPELVYLSEEEHDFIANFAPFITGDNVVQFKEELTKAACDIERNANGKYVLLDMALTFAELLKQERKY
ncbi:MAG: DNA polymerase III subunit delta [Bacteroidales bacterium]|nr:DNA polymerase III subunit delta [Bacteroidales bacterium]